MYTYKHIYNPHITFIYTYIYTYTYEHKLTYIYTNDYKNILVLFQTYGGRVVIDAVMRVPGWQRSGALVTGFKAPRPPLIPASQGICKSHRLPCGKCHERR